MKSNVATKNRIEVQLSSLQQLLLRAAFIKAPPALDAWCRWKMAVDLNVPIDITSLRLLPLVRRNLREQGYDNLSMNRFKGVARHAWVKNHRLLQKYQPILESFERGQIEVIVLGKLAMALRCALEYPNYTDNQIKLLIHPRDFSNAVDRLKAMGWRAIPWLHPDLLPRYVDAAQEHLFTDNAGNHLILRWKVMQNNFQSPHGVDQLRRTHHAVSTTLAVRLLHPTDQLIAICLGVASVPYVPLYDRVADAMMVINREGHQIDWDQVVADAKRYRLARYLRLTLNCIHENLSGSMPPNKIEDLKAVPIDTVQRAEAKFRSAGMTIYGRAVDFCFNYYRAKYKHGLLKKMMGFPKHLQHTWFLWKLRQLPGEALKKILWETKPHQGRRGLVLDECEGGR